MSAWEVLEIELTEEARAYGANATYRYHIRGINHWDGAREFSWTVPAVASADYDLSRVAGVADLSGLPADAALAEGIRIRAARSLRVDASRVYVAFSESARLP